MDTPTNYAQKLQIRVMMKRLLTVHYWFRLVEWVSLFVREVEWVSESPNVLLGCNLCIRMDNVEWNTALVVADTTLLPDMNTPWTNCWRNIDCVIEFNVINIANMNVANISWFSAELIINLSNNAPNITHESLIKRQNPANQNSVNIKEWSEFHNNFTLCLLFAFNSSIVHSLSKFS
jgi:hypothetical protein